MSLLDDLLAGNERFVTDAWDSAEADLVGAPQKALAVLACMDCRVDPERVMGLAPGDAKVVRNAGNRLDAGALRSLVVAVHGLGARAVAVMGHSDCGMTRLVGEKLAAIQDSVPQADRDWLGAFDDAEGNVRMTVAAVAADPNLEGVEVVGLLYEHATGRVRPVA